MSLQYLHQENTCNVSVLSTLDIRIDIRESPIFRNIYLLPALFALSEVSFFFMKIFIKKRKREEEFRYQLSEIELHVGEIFPEFFLSVKLKEDSAGLDKSNKLWYYSTISTRSLVPLQQFPYPRGVLRGRKEKIVAKDQTSNPCDFI